MAIIPNAAAYLEQQANAKNAYDRAVAALKAQRAQRQASAGLLDDWTVNPASQYGAYQALLQGQGRELDAARESSQARGFFGKGLGNQQESMARYGQAVASLGFKNQLSDWEREYQTGLADAKTQQERENLGAVQGAYGAAAESGDWGNPYDIPQGPPVAYSAVSGLSALKQALAGPGNVYTPPKMTSYFAPTAPTPQKRAQQTQTVLTNRQAARRM